MGDPAEAPVGGSCSVGWVFESWVFERSEISVRRASSLEEESPEDVAVDLDPEALDPSSGIVKCG